jgi:hypothetical protein
MKLSATNTSATLVPFAWIFPQTRHPKGKPAGSEPEKKQPFPEDREVGDGQADQRRAGEFEDAVHPKY